MNDIMSPDHPRWSDFLDRLAGPEGCDIREVDGKTVWTCESTHFEARRILAEFGVDVDASIVFFEEHGGGCDCEVILNVGQDDPS